MFKRDPDIKCHNVDEKDRCNAFDRGSCYSNCPARIRTAAGMVDLLRDLRAHTKAGNNWCVNISGELQRFEMLAAEERANVTADWKAAYWEDTHRGGKGGGGEQQMSSEASTKQKMKDNRILATKPTFEEREQVKAATQEWEAENGKLERLGRSSMGKSKVDTYTGEPIVKEKSDG
jgi:hypothetical protein